MELRPTCMDDWTKLDYYRFCLFQKQVQAQMFLGELLGLSLVSIVLPHGLGVVTDRHVANTCVAA